MSYYKIPLTSNPNQTFKVGIPSKDKTIDKFIFNVYYNLSSECWCLNIKDIQGKDLVSNIPLVCGVDLLEQYYYMGLGKAYIINLDQNSREDRPNMYNLESKYILVWSDTEGVK